MYLIHIRQFINIFSCWNICSFSLSKYKPFCSHVEHITGKVNQLKFLDYQKFTTVRKKIPKKENPLYLNTSAFVF